MRQYQDLELSEAREPTPLEWAQLIGYLSIEELDFVDEGGASLIDDPFLSHRVETAAQARSAVDAWLER